MSLTQFIDPCVCFYNRQGSFFLRDLCHDAPEKNSGQLEFSLVLVYIYN